MIPHYEDDIFKYFPFPLNILCCLQAPAPHDPCVCGFIPRFKFTKVEVSALDASVTVLLSPWRQQGGGTVAHTHAIEEFHHNHLPVRSPPPVDQRIQHRTVKLCYIFSAAFYSLKMLKVVRCSLVWWDDSLPIFLATRNPVIYSNEIFLVDLSGIGGGLFFVVS